MLKIPLFYYDPPVNTVIHNVQGEMGEIQTGGIPPAPGTVSVTGVGATALIGAFVALLGAFQPWVSACSAARLQARQDEAKLRTDRITREATWLRSALAVEDSGKRSVALKFLVRAKLIEDPGGVLDRFTLSEIPYLAPVQPAITQDIQNTNPPPPGSALPPRGVGGRGTGTGEQIPR
jgi:hypothetical protein